MINILRIARKTPFLSAEVFENAFGKHFGMTFAIRRADLIPWSQAVLGPTDAPYAFQTAACQFAYATETDDYFCPAYECMQLAPLFMALRNYSGARVRLLFIAHAPGAYIMEWALLRPLLVPGDLLIAPSQSAKQIIELLCPELAPFIRVIPHPIDRLPSYPAEHSALPRLVTLSRITETKLLHRQIDAMRILRERGHLNLRMEIAGALTAGDDPAQELTSYARTLQARILRLGLEAVVHLVGPMVGEQAKAHFLAGAQASVNLSLSVEEAFPKASVEPLGLGIPVIATEWNGFHETVGPAGVFVPVREVAEGVLDVAAHDVASAIAAILQHPPSPEICRRQAEQYAPAAIVPQYQAVLQDNLQAVPRHAIKTDPLAYAGRASDSQGLVGKIAPLQGFSWQELLNFHLEFAQKIRQTWEGRPPAQIYPGEVLQNLLLMSARRPIAYVYAGKNEQKWMEAGGPEGFIAPPNASFAARIASAVQTRAIRSSKEACLFSLSTGKQAELLALGLQFLQDAHEDFQGRRDYEIELEYLRQHYAAAYERFAAAYPVDSILEHDVHPLRQIAKICRQWRQPERALPWLHAWLHKFPDAPESGTIWLDVAANLAAAAGSHAEAIAALNNARALSGELPVIRKLEQKIAGRLAASLWKNP